MKSIGHFQFIHVSPFIKSPLTPIAPQNKMQKFQKTSRKSPQQVDYQTGSME